METLHGILTELGVEDPDMHPEREAPHQSRWIVDQPFVPTIGKSYELAFGKIFLGGESRHVIRRVRVDGTSPDNWIDLNEGKPLDKDLQLFRVKAHRSIE
jgi:hypothetical protein